MGWYIFGKIGQNSAQVDENKNGTRESCLGIGCWYGTDFAANGSGLVKRPRLNKPGDKIRQTNGQGVSCTAQQH
jgi:hypothetical protein